MIDWKEKAKELCPNTILPNHAFACHCEKLAQALESAYRQGKIEAYNDVAIYFRNHAEFDGRDEVRAMSLLSQKHFESKAKSLESSERP